VQELRGLISQFLDQAAAPDTRGSNGTSSRNQGRT
jgi:hypothetical protein